MTERSYQEAVQELRDHIGGLWEGGQTEGRNEMVKILRAELGYDRQAANDAIDAMIKTGQLRYYPPAAQRDISADKRTSTPIMPVGSATGGAVVSAEGGLGGGYWQIGPEDMAPAAGRAGQVTPH
jgi:hypothetical protein